MWTIDLPVVVLLGVAFVGMSVLASYSLAKFFSQTAELIDAKVRCALAEAKADQLEKELEATSRKLAMLQLEEWDRQAKGAPQ